MKRTQKYTYYLKAVILLLFSSYIWTYVVLDFNDRSNPKIEVSSSESNEVSEENFGEIANKDKIVNALNVLNIYTSNSLNYLHLEYYLKSIILETITPPPDYI